MILLTMKFKEIYNQLANDKQKVDIKQEYLFPKAIKLLRKAKKFPACEYFDYKIPSTNNQYVIFYYAENSRCVENPEIGSFCSVFYNNKRYIIRGLLGGYRHTPSSKMIWLPQIHSYTSHFFKRYNERFIKDDKLSSNDVACRFFARNKDIMPIKINEEINKNIDKYGEYAKLGFRVRDGFCFTHNGIEGKFDADGIREKDEVDSMLILYMTYMPEFKMNSIQRCAIDEVHRNTWNKFIEDCHKDASIFR